MEATRWHLQLAQRWILPDNFYINDQRWGRMFVRICLYLPFSCYQERRPKASLARKGSRDVDRLSKWLIYLPVVSQVGNYFFGNLVASEISDYTPF